MIKVFVDVFPDNSSKIRTIELPIQNGVAVVVNDKRDKDISFMNKLYAGEEIMVYYNNVPAYKGIFLGVEVVDIDGERVNSLSVEEKERYINS